MIIHNAGKKYCYHKDIPFQYSLPDKVAWEYNMQKDKYVNMIKLRSVDPLKVVRTVLVDVSGVASLLTVNYVGLSDKVHISFHF
jgi:chaperonin GroEL (HSP60 family)